MLTCRPQTGIPQPIPSPGPIPRSPLRPTGLRPVHGLSAAQRLLGAAFTPAGPALGSPLPSPPLCLRDFVVNPLQLVAIPSLQRPPRASPRLTSAPSLTSFASSRLGGESSRVFSPTFRGVLAPNSHLAGKHIRFPNWPEARSRAFGRAAALRAGVHAGWAGPRIPPSLSSFVPLCLRGKSNATRGNTFPATPTAGVSPAHIPFPLPSLRLQQRNEPLAMYASGSRWCPACDAGPRSTP